IDFASSHAERLSLRRARFPDRRAPWYCLRVRCTRPVRCKRVRGSWTDHHSSWAVTAQPRHAVQLQIVDKLSTIGGPVSWLDKLSPTRYIRRAERLMFRWVSRLSEWDAPSTREPCQRGRLCPRSGRLDTRCSKRHRSKRPQTQARMVSGNEEVCYG